MLMWKYLELGAELLETSIGPLKETNIYIRPGFRIRMEYLELRFTIENWQFCGAGEEGLPNNSWKEIEIACALSRAKLHIYSVVSDVPDSKALCLSFSNMKMQQLCFYFSFLCLN